MRGGRQGGGSIATEVRRTREHVTSDESGFAGAWWTTVGVPGADKAGTAGWGQRMQSKQQ
jgi:hypothetical protein